MISGSFAQGFEQVREAFGVLFDEMGEQGAAVAAVVGHNTVVDLWGGTPDADAAWSAATRVNTYSVAKPLIAMTVLALVEAGVLGLDAAVSTYWPDYSQNDKGDTTVRHLLAHQAGLPAFDDAALDLTQWQACADALAAAAPLWTPGTAHGEHALTYGYLLGEVVRRATGTTIGAQLEALVARPLGIEFSIGAAARCDVATVVDPTGRWGAALVEGRDELYRRALMVPPGALDPALVNSSAWRQAEIPAVNGHGTARAVAAFYAAMAAGGRGIVGQALLDEALTPQATGLDRVLGRDVSWGLGPQIDGAEFGLGGIGGHVGYGNLDGGFGFGFVTRTLGGFERADLVAEAFEACL